MKKSNFIALIGGVIGGLLFALGMCMALLPEWNAFLPGVIIGGIGLALMLATLLVWRKLTGKPPIRWTGRGVLTVAVGVGGALLLGVGMCCCMVWEQLLIGIPVGVAGIAALLCLIPLLKGLHD